MSSISNNIPNVLLQFEEQAERIHHLEYECEEMRSDVQIKARQLHDQQENIGELKGELASIREQKCHSENEVISAMN